ncbi:Coronin-like protein crn1 [Rhodotorula toruloides]
MSRFVRSSLFRHTYGSPAKPENRYDNIKISASAFDTNLVSASDKYLAVNWQASGGGAYVVTPLDITGKLPDIFPLVRAHTAPVLDTAFSPFDNELVASVGEDGKLALTRVDDQIIRDAWNRDRKDLPDMEPLWRENAHGRKAGHVKFNPVAQGVLATASTDVKIWDLEAQKSSYQSETHADMVQSIDWDWTGSTYATGCKDKKLRIFDPRAGSAAVTVVDSHSGVKGSRVLHLGNQDRIVTTGFSRTSDRQLFLWDARELNKGPIKQMNIDQSSGMLMPFFSAGTNVLFLAGKGDGNVRMYEYDNDELFYLSDYGSSQPQRGMCFAPAHAVNVEENEIARAYKAVGTTIEPVSFIVPRKSEAFQADLFPPAPSDQPALSAADWFGGKSSNPIMVDMETRTTSSSSEPVKPYKPTAAPAAAPASTPAPAPVEKSAPAPTAATPQRAASPPPPAPAPVAAAPRAATPPPAAPATNGASAISNGGSKDDGEVAALREENEQLRADLAEKDAVIRELELKLERVKSALA